MTRESRFVIWNLLWISLVIVAGYIIIQPYESSHLTRVDVDVSSNKMKVSCSGENVLIDTIHTGGNFKIITEKEVIEGEQFMLDTYFLEERPADCSNWTIPGSLDLTLRGENIKIIRYPNWGDYFFAAF